MKKILEKLKRIGSFFRNISTHLFGGSVTISDQIGKTVTFDTLSLNHPHRQPIVDAVRKKSKVESL